MKLNSYIYRYFRFKKKDKVFAHLGPGQRNYVKGWVNVDANFLSAKCDIWADLRDPLPFPDNSVDAFYSHHVIEHLPDMYFHFKELFRCLKPNGVFRIGAPNGDMAAKMFIENKSEWFSNFPDNKKSIGGRLNNFIFCRNEHLHIISFSYLKEICESANLGPIKQVLPETETNYPNIFAEKILKLEHEITPEYPHTLIIEGQKCVNKQNS
jgi:SAM-dependent methyltransferase